MASNRVASNRMRWSRRPVVIHSARTGVATLASFLVARLFRLPEAYWAPITTIVITQSSLGAAWEVSWQRFVGTLIGAALGAIVASYFEPSAFVFGVCVFVLGLLCAMVRADRSAYRFGGVTLAIVLLLPHLRSPWIAAFHRSAEVSIGIGVALIFSAVWPEEEETPLEAMPFSYLPKPGSDDFQVRT
jgi:uncharacterized membrane protein YgaE (UPF0421/DUF939 family)